MQVAGAESGRSWSGIGARGVLLLLAAWLVWALVKVNIDLDDGYATIVNSQYFLGLSDYHIFIRGPLMGLLLTPAEWLANQLDLHPFDVRPHHAIMALAHFGYLLGVWRVLVRTHGCDRWTLLAFVAAVPTVVFFSYAPYISHDIFPGLLAVWLVWLAHRFVSSPATDARIWAAMVLLGAVLALIKQTYALVFMAVLVAESLLAMVAVRSVAPSPRLARVSLLALAALAAGTVTWAIYAAFLKEGFADKSFWSRPLHLVELVGNIYRGEGGDREVFFQGLYPRNLWAYGILAMTLILPAAGLALRTGSEWERRLALVWMLLLAALLVVPQKETRYLAFLAPFHALLLVPMLRLIAIRRRWFPALALLVLVCDLALAVPEALRLRDPWYRESVTGFLQPIPTDSPLHGRLIMGAQLAFVAPESWAFHGDRYHRITHVSFESVAALFAVPRAQLVRLRPGQGVRGDFLKDGDYWAMANMFVARTRPFVGGNLPGLQRGFEQFVARAEWLELERTADQYRVVGADTNIPLVLLNATGDRRVLGRSHFSAREVDSLLGVSGQPTSLRVIGLRVLRSCTLTTCQAFGQD